MAKKLRIEDIEQKIAIVPLSRGEINHCIRCRVLIVCEGSKTEPNYFNSFSMMKNSSSFVFEVFPEGGGISTLAVVDKAVKLRDKAVKDGRPYDSVWAVFDKDGFPDFDFDNAIVKAEQSGIGCAWSNEAFELWYVYHFDDRNTPMSRKDYEGVITKRIRTRLRDKKYKYVKNDEEMRNNLSRCGCDENIAIRRAENQANGFQNSRYHKHNPCTTVYKLVRLLIGKDVDFNEKIKQSVEDK